MNAKIQSNMGAVATQERFAVFTRDEDDVMNLEDELLELFPGVEWAVFPLARHWTQIVIYTRTAEETEYAKTVICWHHHSETESPLYWDQVKVQWASIDPSKVTPRAASRHPK